MAIIETLKDPPKDETLIAIGKMICDKNHKFTFDVSEITRMLYVWHTTWVPWKFIPKFATRKSTQVLTGEWVKGKLRIYLWERSFLDTIKDTLSDDVTIVLDERTR